MGKGAAWIISDKAHVPKAQPSDMGASAPLTRVPSFLLPRNPWETEADTKGHRGAAEKINMASFPRLLGPGSRQMCRGVPGFEKLPRGARGRSILALALSFQFLREINPNPILPGGHPITAVKQ